jgi:hypothetical protein
MALIPKDKRWTQNNDGDSSGVLHASWNIDLNKNRGAASVSNPLKKVTDGVAFANLDNPVAKFVEYSSHVWAISNKVFKSSDTIATDITDGGTWSQDVSSGTPSVGATVTDAVVFNDYLLVVDGDDIKYTGGSGWGSWWKGTLAQSGLTAGQPFVLKVGPDGNLYITNAGNKVYRVTTTNGVTKTGEGTLDFSATKFIITNGTTTSSRIFYGTEDTGGENCAIIEWDMSPQSISANRIHRMGAKRILVMMTWNDTPIAVLSDGSIKYFNGTSFVDWKGAKLPRTKYQYLSDVIHKNGWSIIDGLPHFLINPSVDIDETSSIEDSSQNWNYPAGIYCLDPELGLYCRYALTDGDKQLLSLSHVGALLPVHTKNTKFFASYDVYDTTTSDLSVIACEDADKTNTSTSWLVLQPFESVGDITRKLTTIHRKLGTGDRINVYYRKNDEDSVHFSGYWVDTTHINTTDDTTNISEGDVLVVKIGSDGESLNTVKKITRSASVSTVEVVNAVGVSLNDASHCETVNFKSMGSITNTGVEISPLSIPEPKQSRQVWVWLEIIQAPGNNIQIDYLITE